MFGFLRKSSSMEEYQATIDQSWNYMGERISELEELVNDARRDAGVSQLDFESIRKKMQRFQKKKTMAAFDKGKRWDLNESFQPPLNYTQMYANYLEYLLSRRLHKNVGPGNMSDDTVRRVARAVGLPLKNTYNENLDKGSVLKLLQDMKYVRVSEFAVDETVIKRIISELRAEGVVIRVRKSPDNHSDDGIHPPATAYYLGTKDDVPNYRTGGYEGYFGGLKINHITGCAIFDGRRAMLSNRQYELLVLIAEYYRDYKKPIPIDELSTRIYGDGNSTDVIITTKCHIVSDLPGCIVAVRGYGYRIGLPVDIAPQPLYRLIE